MEKIILDDSGRYEVEMILGVGGTSRVYRAYDTRLKKDVAVKVLQDYDIARQEIKILGELNHRRIPYLIDCYEYENQMVLVMQYIEGVTMEQYFTRHHEITERETYDFLLELIDILQYLHHQKNPILYLDLKPENIMIGLDGKVYLIDFGAARYQYYEESELSLYGTATYAPKELLECQSNQVIDVRSDIYSLGMIGIYMQTAIGKKKMVEKGRRNLKAYVNARVTERKFNKVVAKCANELAEKRYQTIDELEVKQKPYKQVNHMMLMGKHRVLL